MFHLTNLGYFGKGGSYIYDHDDNIKELTLRSFVSTLWTVCFCI